MLEDYFRRIGFQGTPGVDLATLAALQRHHIGAIPFEAVDVLAGRRIGLAPAAILTKLVTRGRGGYCFEHNRLFEMMLLELGFTVRRMLGRVWWLRDPDGPPPPRTHLVLEVTLEGQKWLVDVGFGGTVPDAPLLIESNEPQRTRHDLYRLEDGSEGRRLMVLRDGDWLPAYEILMATAQLSDLETANWYTSTHPASHFRTGLRTALCTPEARLGLSDRQFSKRFVDGRVEKRVLSDEELLRVLTEDFLLPKDLPDFPMPE